MYTVESNSGMKKELIKLKFRLLSSLLMWDLGKPHKSPSIFLKIGLKLGHVTQEGLFAQSHVVFQLSGLILLNSIDAT